MISKSTLFTSSGSFSVPSTVSLIFITSCGGGCGGGTSINFSSSGAGGAPESCVNFPLPVTPSSTLTVTVGAAGVGAGGGSNHSGAKGTNSVVSGGFVLGPYLAYAAPNQNPSFPSPSNVGGPGGGVGGYDPAGGATKGFLGKAESSVHFGGSSGGCGEPTGTIGGGSGGTVGGAAGGGGAHSGGGGASSPFGTGGAGGADVGAHPGATGTGNGSGGGGGANNGAGGNGTKGYVLIQWAA